MFKVRVVLPEPYAESLVHSMAETEPPANPGLFTLISDEVPRGSGVRPPYSRSVAPQRHCNCLCIGSPAAS